MKRLFILSLFCIFSLVSCASPKSTPVRAPDGLHSHIGESTVALVHYKIRLHKDENGEIDNATVEVRPHCTGVWISPDEIVTAAHCVDNDADPVGEKVLYTVQREVKEVLDDPSAIHKAKVVAFDPDNDVALIKADVGGLPAHEYASLATELPAIGEHVYSVGHPMGMYYTYAEGTVSAYRGEDSSGVGKVVQVNASVWYGNSGGGVFDSSGNLVGICSRLTRVPQMNYYIHLDSVKRMVKEFHTPTPDLSKK